MLPPLLGKAVKVLKLSHLLSLDLLYDTRRFVWSKVFVLAALAMVKARANVEGLPVDPSSVQTSRLVQLSPLPCCPLPIINVQGGSWERNS